MVWGEKESYLIYTLAELCPYEIISMKIGSALQLKNRLHLNFNRIMSFAVFSLKIVSTVSFFKTIEDVDLCFTSRPFKIYS